MNILMRKSQFLNRCRSLSVVALLLLVQTVFAADVDPFSTREAVSPTPISRSVGQNHLALTCQFAPTSDPSVLLSLLDVIERALCRNTVTRQAWINVKIQASFVGLNESAYLPTITAGMNTSRNKIATEVPSIPELSNLVYPNIHQTNLTIGWLLFDSGLRNAATDNARQLLAAAEALQDVALQNTLISAINSYYDLVTAQSVYNSYIDAENSAKGSYIVADGKYKAGAGTLADKLQAATTFSQASLNRVKAYGDMVQKHGILAVVMGLSANDVFGLSAINDAVGGIDDLLPIDALISQAKMNHPSILAARAQLQAALANVDIIVAQGKPSISIVGSFQRSNEFGQYPASTYIRENSIGIQLNVPIFEGFGRSYQVLTARSQVDAADLNLDDALQKLSLSIWNSYQSLLSEIEDVKTTQDLLDNASLSYDVAKGRYKSGVGSILELLSAQNALASSRIQRIQAVSNYRVARFSLLSSLGRLNLGDIH